MSVVVSLQPGRRRQWWKQSPQHRRLVQEEIAYLLTEGPLVVSAAARLFAWELWRKSYGASSSWPTHVQFGQLFQVSPRSIRRWVDELEAAGMVTFHRPYDSSKPSVYDLHPPSQWQYRDGWQYRGEFQGWVDPTTGECVQWPLESQRRSPASGAVSPTIPRMLKDNFSPRRSGSLKPSHRTDSPGAVRGRKAEAPPSPPHDCVGDGTSNGAGAVHLTT